MQPAEQRLLRSCDARVGLALRFVWGRIDRVPSGWAGNGPSAAFELVRVSICRYASSLGLASGPFPTQRGS
jgi:hypothetical protein